MNKVVIITGGTSGIGLATARRLRDMGCTVYEFSRRPTADTPNHLSVDVTDERAARAAVEAVAAQAGRIDVLINNAGFGISGAMEFTASADAHRLMEVNLFGMDNMIRAVLPHMRGSGGRIVNISSVAGVYAIPFQAWYSISKAAVRALTMALANEVAPYGVQVTSVLPGDIRTGFTAAREKSALGDDAYGGRITRSVSRMERDEQRGMSPEAAARTIVRVATRRGGVKPEYTIGLSYKCLVFLGRLLPCGLVRKLLFMLYGR